MRKHLLILVALLCPIGLGAQTPAAKDAHHMNALILSTVDEYARTAAMSESSDIRAFQRLFENPDGVCLVNDIPGTPGYMSEMTPRDYSRLVDPDSGCLIKIEVSKVRKEGNFFQQGGKWHRRITLDKYVMFIDNTVYAGEEGGVFFDTDNLLSGSKGVYSLVLDMVYSQEKDRCLISSVGISGKEQATALDGGSFYVVLKPDQKFLDKTLYNGSPITFNEYGQAFVSTMDNVQYDSDDYEIRPVTEASSSLYDVMNLEYRKLHHFRFKPRYSMTLGGAFGMAAVPENVNFTSMSKASEIGLDIGFLFAKGGHSHTGLYTGAAYSSSSLSMQAGEFQYDYLPQRRYKVSSASESLAFTDLMIPLYLESEFKLGKYINLSVDLGAKLYVNLDNQILEPYKINGQITAGASVMDFDILSEDAGFLDPGSYAKEPLDLSFFSNLELSVRIVKFMYLFASAGYELGIQGLLPAYAPQEVKTYYSVSGTNPVFPVAYGGGTNFLFRSFAQSIAFHRQGAWISFGLKFKLNI